MLRHSFSYVIRSMRPRLGRVRSWVRMLRAVAGGNDSRRWATVSNLFSEWDDRTRLIASLIPPGKTVLEFGAGRMLLQRLLPAGTIYIPSDLVDRGPGTVVVDLNTQVYPKFPSHDIAVFGGVLEYVTDVARLVSRLREDTLSIIASYAVVTDSRPRLHLGRRKQGWINDFSENEFVELFAAEGYRCERRILWGDQVVCVFTRQ